MNLQGTSANFVDLNDAEWAKNYINALASNKITNGYADNTFKPNHSISRAEFSLLLARVLDDRFKLNVLPEMEVNPTLEVYVDGIKVNYPVKPIVKNGTTLVPIRETFEAMGVKVEWNEEEQIFLLNERKYENKIRSGLE